VPRRRRLRRPLRRCHQGPPGPSRRLLPCRPVQSANAPAQNEVGADSLALCKDWDAKGGARPRRTSLLHCPPVRTLRTCARKMSGLRVRCGLGLCQSERTSSRSAARKRQMLVLCSALVRRVGSKLWIRSGGEFVAVASESSLAHVLSSRAAAAIRRYSSVCFPLGARPLQQSCGGSTWGGRPFAGHHSPRCQVAIALCVALPWPLDIRVPLREARHFPSLPDFSPRRRSTPVLGLRTARRIASPAAADTRPPGTLRQQAHAPLRDACTAMT
jgi:hypothetical protein